MPPKRKCKIISELHLMYRELLIHLLLAMRTLIPILACFMFASQCHGQLEKDKVLHFVGGAAFGLVGGGIAKKVSKGDRVWTFVGAVAASAMAGVAKEAIDAGQPDNQWDNGDLLATILGGVAVGISIELFSKKDTNGKLQGNYSLDHGPTRIYDSHGMDELIAGLNGELRSLQTLGLSSCMLCIK